MNKERLEQAIAVMKRAGKVVMSDWQTGEVRETEAELHECGTAACFAGWLAVSPEFQAAGGKVGMGGNPLFSFVGGFRAITEWLEIKDPKAVKAVQVIVYGRARVTFPSQDPREYLAFPVVEEVVGDGFWVEVVGWHNWSAENVIEALEGLKACA